MRFRFRSGCIAAALCLFLLSACGSSADTSNPALDANGRLAERTKVTFSISSTSLLVFLPVIMAKQYGEFDARNIDLDIQLTDPANAIALMSTGKLDGMMTGVTAGIFNSIASGSGVRIVANAYQLPPDSTAGWYASTAALAGRPFDPALLGGQKVASSNGVTTSVALTMADTLARANLTLKDVQGIALSPSDIVAAVQSGSVAAGMVAQPLQEALIASGRGIKIADGYPKNSPALVWMLGSSILKDRPNVAKAFVAAIRATNVKHLQGDFLHGPGAQDIANALELPLDKVQANTSDVYPARLGFPSDYVARYDQAWREVPELLQYDQPLTQDAVIDPQFMDYANSLPM